MLNGIINLDKPPGLSSAYVVNGVKRLLPKGTKIGHAGTLDPFATGVLLLLVGKATKSCETFMGERKGYEATIKLGARTATDDPTSPEQPVEVAAPPTQAQIRHAATRFVGAIQQRPPAFSALKIGGRRAYKLARRGDVVELAPRTVTVYGLDVVDYRWPLVWIRVECGRGTYIRAIARDLGDALGVGGHLTELRRTFVGRFRAEEGVTVEKITTDGVAQHLHPVEQGTPLAG